MTSGLAIYDTMQYVLTPVCTWCVGQAASMGSLLLAAGAPGMRHALPNARIMVHQPSGGARVRPPPAPRAGGGLGGGLRGWWVVLEAGGGFWGGEEGLGETLKWGGVHSSCIVCGEGALKERRAMPGREKGGTWVGKDMLGPPSGGYWRGWVGMGLPKGVGRAGDAPNSPRPS